MFAMASSAAPRANDDPLTYRIIGCAIVVHRSLGPGLLESVYEECLEKELASAGLKLKRQPVLAVSYEGRILHRNYRPDFVVEDQVVVEVKAVSELSPVHLAQVLTYLKLSQIERGLLINFNVAQLVRGIKRVILSRTPAV
jgi:GxxExxY protein